MMTKAYASTSFSDETWSSPEKTAMIARYRELISQGGM